MVWFVVQTYHHGYKVQYDCLSNSYLLDKDSVKLCIRNTLDLPRQINFTMKKHSSTFILKSTIENTIIFEICTPRFI